MFKDLPDYKQELIEIYQKITNRVNYLVCKAKNYYITGSRSTPKTIEISRELVKWDKPL